MKPRSLLLALIAVTGHVALAGQNAPRIGIIPSAAVILSERPVI